ncbi:hypothetical protein GCM10023403_48130 [Pseudonocardia benzenivorans]|nr:hypothetical protein PSD17_35330 [Pseudonocardia sp. D17]
MPVPDGPSIATTPRSVPGPVTAPTPPRTCPPGHGPTRRSTGRARRLSRAADHCAVRPLRPCPRITPGDECAGRDRPGDLLLRDLLLRQVRAQRGRAAQVDVPQVRT